MSNRIIVGIGSEIAPTAGITGYKRKDWKCVIGDHTYIGPDVQIVCDDFHIGDYGKIHHHTNIHGNKVHIGHNAWIGQYCVIDGLGEAIIGDNCGIGAHSQLWSHIKFGDTLAGCQFNKEKQLLIGKDVWFVGHCIVSPVRCGDQSMALVGSVVTKNMLTNEIYSGVPAKGTGNPQFVFGKYSGGYNKEWQTEKMSEYLTEYMDTLASKEFERLIQVCWSEDDIAKRDRDNGASYFFIKERTYTKTGSAEEVRFMKFLLPEKAKFTPL